MKHRINGGILISVFDLQSDAANYSWMLDMQSVALYGLAFQSRGFLVIKTREQKTVFHGPNIVALVPNELRSLDFQESEGFLILFNSQFFSLRYHENVLSKFEFFRRTYSSEIKLDESAVPKWINLLSAMKREYLQKADGYESVLRSMLNVVLVHAHRLLNVAETRLNRADNILIKRVFESIELNHKQSKLPSEYAKMLNLSPNYLNKVCKTETGFTIGELIRNRVLVEAKTKLLTTEESIKSIAYELGFNSPSHFVTLFKKNEGISPEVYRKKNRMQDS